MPKAPPPSQILEFKGKRDWPLVPGVDDWGLTTEQQESYVEQFRRIIESKQAWNEEEHDYFVLRRFMRARTYDLERATAMWLNHIAWQKEFSVNTILQDFYFAERDEFVEAYPQGYHKLDKVGRPIYIQQLGKIDINKLKKICSEDRMLKFHIQEYERCRKVILPVCSRLAGHHIDQTFGIMDVSGVGLGHLTGEIKRLMSLVTKYDQDNYPEMLGHICIINAPGVFRMLWNVIKGLIDPRTQSKIEILGTDYKKGVLKWVEEENLPKWLGGTSEGTLISDIGPWSDPELCARIGVDIEALRSGKKLPPLLHLGTAQSRRYAAVAATGGSQHKLPSSSSLRLSADGSLIRQSNDSNGGFATPRRCSGVPEGLVDEVARKYAETMSSGSATSMHRTSHPDGINLTIREDRPSESAMVPLPAAAVVKAPSDGRSRVLIKRLADLEQRLPPHMERLRNGTMAPERNGAAAIAAGTGTEHSTKSAPGGSLLNRVEVLEDAMDALLVAQEAALLYQQQLLDAQEAAKLTDGQAAAKPSCCVVM